MRGRLFLGTSGFAYPEWKGSFYPRDIKPAAMLAYYAQHFPSVEINYTFSKTPEPSTVEAWLAQTPADFVFSLKAHRAVTHMFRLTDKAARPLEEMLSACAPLAGRMGAILFGLAANFKADLPRLDAFLASLPGGHRYAFEFRHETWLDDAVHELLRSHGAAWCVSDTDERACPFERTAPDFTYLRLRKDSYSDEELAAWAGRIGDTLAGGADVYCYLKHEDEARGVSYARKLGKMLAVSASPQPAREGPS